ncbi:hypothetical protein DL93DRAFT_2161726 [Clavulina sp. PMI_390]|nr:hypothetical protein DL93DRAFT_2161726 [Clavulina sp. PMI_390]
MSEASIGIRVSVYVQALLPLFLSYVDQYAGADQTRRAYNRDTASSLVLTGMALIVSAIVQHFKQGLTAFHAFIVLNICWVTIMVSLPVFVMGILDNVANLEELYGEFMSSLFSLKLCLMGAFGLWLNITVRTFDKSPTSCTSTTTLWWFGHHVAVVSKESRSWQLFLYSLLLLPGINAGGLVWVVLGQWLENFVSAVGKAIWRHQWPKARREQTMVVFKLCQGITSLIYWAFIFVVIAMTEMSIRINAIQPGENDWTLGQTFAALVAFILYESQSRTSLGSFLLRQLYKLVLFFHPSPLYEFLMNCLPWQITSRQKTEILEYADRFSALKLLEVAVVFVDVMKEYLDSPNEINPSGQDMYSRLEGGDFIVSTAPERRFELCQNMMTQVATIIRGSTTIEVAPFTFPWRLLINGIPLSDTEPPAIFATDHPNHDEEFSAV